MYLVQFPDGKYGIAKRNLFGVQAYLSVGNTWWSRWTFFGDHAVERFCAFDTREEAMARMEAYLHPPTYVPYEGKKVTDTLPQKCGECGQEHKFLLKFDRGLLVCRACLGSAHYLIEEAERDAAGA